MLVFTTFQRKENHIFGAFQDNSNIASFVLLFVTMTFLLKVGYLWVIEQKNKE